MSFPSKTTKRTTKWIAYTALLVALSVVINIFDVPLGAGTNKLTFTYVPVFIAGMFMGPLSGLIVGALGDVIGILISPQGGWLWYITVSAALMGLITGIIFRFVPLNSYVKLAIALVSVFVVCTVGINTTGFFLTFAKGKKTFAVYLLGRLPLQSIVFAFNTAVLYLLYKPLDKLIFKGQFGKSTST